MSTLDELNGVAGENSLEENPLATNLLSVLSSEVKSPLLLKDLHLYEPAIRARLENEFNDEDLNNKIKEDILEMDEWLSSADVEDEVWKIVLDKTMQGMILTAVNPDDVSHPDSLIFENVD
ncbi:MAG: hypothetical protein LBH96_06895 [Candidatus Peribacteria bacterium]|jgi:hypothetical protein|nr:hypothetical protein [Candidatus Peribacteria bacterium]